MICSHCFTPCGDYRVVTSVGQAEEINEMSVSRKRRYLTCSKHIVAACPTECYGGDLDHCRRGQKAITVKPHSLVMYGYLLVMEGVRRAHVGLPSVRQQRFRGREGFEGGTCGVQEVRVHTVPFVTLEGRPSAVAACLASINECDTLEQVFF